MADGIYPTLGRQAGLLREMDVIAQNIANHEAGLPLLHLVDRKAGY